MGRTGIRTCSLPRYWARALAACFLAHWMGLRAWTGPVPRLAACRYIRGSAREGGAADAAHYQTFADRTATNNSAVISQTMSARITYAITAPIDIQKISRANIAVFPRGRRAVQHCAFELFASGRPSSSEIIVKVSRQLRGVFNRHILGFYWVKAVYAVVSSDIYETYVLKYKSQIVRCKKAFQRSKSFTLIKK